MFSSQKTVEYKIASKPLEPFSDKIRLTRSDPQNEPVFEISGIYNQTQTILSCPKTVHYKFSPKLFESFHK